LNDPPIERRKTRSASLRRRHR